MCPSLALRASICTVLLGPCLALAAEFRPTAQDTIVPAGARLEMLWGEGDFTEGPAAAPDGVILFSDIGDRILRFDPRTKGISVFRQPSGKANGLAFDAAGRLVACEGANGGNRRVTVTATDGAVTVLAGSYQGKRFNSPNDVAIDAAGRVYFSDPRYVGEEPLELDFAGVFVVAAPGEVRLATREVTKPNGLVVSRDGRTLYVADNDSATDGNHQLLAFSVERDGLLANKRVLFDFGPNFRGIDGMTIDAEGNLYATAGKDEAAGVYVFDPAGKPLALIATPGAPSNCEFGRDPDGKLLYITCAVAPAAPNQGDVKHGLFRIRLLKGR